MRRTEPSDERLVGPGPRCTLRLALGESEECPGASCPLWGEEGCVLAPVDFELRNTPALACHLVELKIALERAAATDEAAQTRSRFYRRLNARAEA